MTTEEAIQRGILIPQQDQCPVCSSDMVHGFGINSYSCEECGYTMREHSFENLLIPSKLQEL